MKKLLLLLTIAACAFSSCGEIERNNSNSAFLPGTTWENTNGNIVSFTRSTISYDGTTSPYSVTAGADNIAVYFSIENLKIGEKTFVSGAAYETERMLVLNYQSSDGRGNEHFSLKK